AAPGETGGEANDRADRNKKNDNSIVKLPDPRVFIARETVCPLACSAEPGRCSWSCSPLRLRENEVAA
ncbi:hypothetical protein, partial [Ilumatobacter sp.]|uniref:hypothetical protein n=1 Tax=Ilumatobacter sp. TaxID=1967498 RepID=UPI0037502A6D